MKLEIFKSPSADHKHLFADGECLGKFKRNAGRPWFFYWTISREINFSERSLKEVDRFVEDAITSLNITARLTA